MMAKTFDEIRRHKENALDDLKETGERLFRLGYNNAKLKAEEEQKAREETAEWMDATDEDKKRYNDSYHCIDDLAYWCSKCKSPLSGHWASVKWWFYCPWCGRKLLSTEEERTTAIRKVWELMQKPEGDNA